MNQKRIIVSVLAAVLVLAAAAGTIARNKNGQMTQASRQMFAMDTVISLQTCGRDPEAALQKAADELERLDKMFSTGNPESEISRLNRDGGGEVSDETLAVIRTALEVYEDTDGRFDISIYPIMRLWGFTDGNYHVARPEELAAVLPYVDAGKIEISGRRVTLGEGQEIDLGGIAKGYASARLMELFREAGMKNALVSLGGNVQTFGSKSDGSKWNIGIRLPQKGTQEVAATLKIQDKAVITSGGYERYFVEDGSTYIHIVDPKTGRPADSDLVSVTVVSKDGMMADALSTALYLMGYEEACEYWRAHKEIFDMVLMKNDGKICITEPLEGDFDTPNETAVIR